MSRRPKFVFTLALLFVALLTLRGSVLTVPSGTWQPTGNLSVARAGASCRSTAERQRLDHRGRVRQRTSCDCRHIQHRWLYLHGRADEQPARKPRIRGPSGRPRARSRRLHDRRRCHQLREIFDPIANTWTSVPGGMTEARAGATAALLNDGRVFLAGGQGSASTVSSIIEIFDPTANAFSFAGTLSSPRNNHASAILNDGRVLVVGGTDANNNILASSDIFDSVAGTVSAGPSLATPRQSASATTLLDGRVLIAGGTGSITNPDGSTNSVDLGSAEILNAAATAFTLSASPMITARSGHQAFLLPHNSSVLILGGSANGAATSSAELFIPWTGAGQAGAFQTTAALSTARFGATGSALSNNQPTSQNDGVLLVAGGTDASSPAKTLATTELYGFAWVKTDQADYAPGTTVTITGSGWQPGETVTLSFLESPLIDTHPTLTAIADSHGNIVNTQFSPPTRMTSASSSTSPLLARPPRPRPRSQTNTSLQKIMVLAQTPSAVAPGGAATYSVTVSFNGNGTCTASLSVGSGLPSGTVVPLARVRELEPPQAAL